MFTLARLAILTTAAISVVAIPSHHARQGLHHREIAARVAQPEVAPVPEMAARYVPAPTRRRMLKRGGGRCNPSSVTPSSSPPANPAPSPSPSPSVEGDERKKPQPSTPAQDPASSPSPSPSPDQPNQNQPDQNQPNQPEPTPTPTPTPTTSPDSTPTSGSGNNGGGQTYTGQGTFYSTGLGACGITNNDGQDIAAVSHLFFDSFPGYDGVNPNANPMCGKTAQVTFEGKTITVQLTDRCEACAYGDLDFSPHAFDQLADPSLGRISGISWFITN